MRCEICKVGTPQQQCPECPLRSCLQCLQFYRLDSKIGKLICPVCALYMLNPMNKVEILFTEPLFIHCQNQNNEIKVTLNLKGNAKFTHIEVRCVKLESRGVKYLQELSFPDHFILRLGGDN